MLFIYYINTIIPASKTEKEQMSLSLTTSYYTSKLFTKNIFWKIKNKKEQILLDSERL